MRLGDLKVSPCLVPLVPRLSFFPFKVWELKFLFPFRSLEKLKTKQSRASSGMEKAWQLHVSDPDPGLPARRLELCYSVWSYGVAASLASICLSYFSQSIILCLCLYLSVSIACSVSASSPLSLSVSLRSLCLSQSRTLSFWSLGLSVSPLSPSLSPYRGATSLCLSLSLSLGLHQPKHLSVQPGLLLILLFQAIVESVPIYGSIYFYNMLTVTDRNRLLKITYSAGTIIGLAIPNPSSEDNKWLYIYLCVSNPLSSSSSATPSPLVEPTHLAVKLITAGDQWLACRTSHPKQMYRVIGS